MFKKLRIKENIAGVWFELQEVDLVWGKKKKKVDFGSQFQSEVARQK